MWDLVGNPEDRFSHNEAQFSDIKDTAVKNHPVIQTNWFYSREIPTKDADRFANSASRSGLIWVCTVCPKTCVTNFEPRIWLKVIYTKY